MSEPAPDPPTEAVEIQSEKKDEAEGRETDDSNNQLEKPEEIPEEKLEEKQEDKADAAEEDNEKNEKVVEEKMEELALPRDGAEGETD